MYKQPELQKHLKTRGYSTTLPRRLVFEYLLSSGGPVTIHSVIEACADRIDRASVYRALEVFREIGLIHDLVINGSRVLELSDIASPHHHHLTCSSCGHTETIHDKGLETRLHELALAYGFRPGNHQIELSGLCRDCR